MCSKYLKGEGSTKETRIENHGRWWFCNDKVSFLRPSRTENQQINLEPTKAKCLQNR